MGQHDGDHRRIGRKAVGLGWLVRSGRAVPPFAVVPVGSADLPADVEALLEGSTPLAVRSSSPAEDGADHSYAGQFSTELDVEPTLEAVRSAVGRVVDSADSDRVGAYAGGELLDMAVIVQRMVPAAASGVSFSRHPVTGLDEVVVESIAGRGDALVSGLVTPDRWVFRWGAFTERPAEGDAELAERVARETRAIAAEYGAPVDLEWAWDGETLWWLQVRPITGLDGVHVHSRRIAKEVLPGIITPLTWSVNVPVVNRAWIKLLERGVGDTGLSADDLARRFGARAYFDMTALGAVFERMGMPRDSLELLLGLDDGPEKPAMRPSTGTALLRAPRLATLAAWLLRYRRRVAAELHAIEAEADADPLDPTWSDEALAGAIRRAMDRAERAALANIAIPLMAQAYAARARSALEAAGIDPDGIDPTAGLPGAGDHDPERQLGDLREALAVAPDAVRAAAAEGDWEAVVADAGAAAVVAASRRYLDRFGALSDRTTDLTAVPWREQPGTVLKLASQAGVERTGRPVGDVTPDRKLRGRTERAGSFQILREEVSQAYTRIYMDLRPLLFEAGGRFTDRGWLPATDDVTLLTVDEILDALGSGSAPAVDLEPRRLEMAEAEDYRVPELIVGDDFVPIPRSDNITELTGVGSSRGRVQGVVKVVRDPAEAPDVPDGTVVVVPHSDVSWTPLFTRSLAIVAEAGGMLSHSSIVARELGIPCVVSAAGATDLADGTTVVVDGYAGVVTVVA